MTPIVPHAGRSARGSLVPTRSSMSCMVAPAALRHHGGVDVSRVMVLREMLASSGWVERTQGFARTMRRRTTEPGGLLLVGTPEAEPWHLAAHLDDESRLVRHPAAEPHTGSLPGAAGCPRSPVRDAGATRGRAQGRDGLRRQRGVRTRDAARARMGRPQAGCDRSFARRRRRRAARCRSRVSCRAVAAEPTLVVPELDVVSFDSVQHLVSVAAGEAAQSPSSTSVRERMAKLLEHIAGPRIS